MVYIIQHMYQFLFSVTLWLHHWHCREGSVHFLGCSRESLSFQLHLIACWLLVILSILLITLLWCRSIYWGWQLIFPQSITKQFALVYSIISVLICLSERIEHCLELVFSTAGVAICKVQIREWSCFFLVPNSRSVKLILIKLVPIEH